MADTTGISWCDKTMNPWLGCEKVSPACARCYAETMATGRMGLDVWGPDATRRVAAESTWRKPLGWNRESERFGRSRLRENPGGAGERIRVFCASMADVFEERADLEEPRQRLFELIAATPALDWLILTKRPEFMRDWLSQMPIMGALPLPNVWLGVSIENSRFTWRADVLREIPAVVRFISAEPLLGSLYDEGRRGERRTIGAGRRSPLDLSGIDWLIVGGESGGRKSRPMHPDWARELRDDARARGIAFHFKQHGSWGPAAPTSGVYPGDLFWTVTPGSTSEERYVVGDGYICAPNESEADHLRYHGPGPKASGKTLDGVDYCEFPTARVLA